MCSGRGYLEEAYYAIYQNDYQKAIRAFKKAIQCEPSNSSFHYKLSITYSRNGDIKDALEYAKKACELQPNNQTYRYHLQILESKNLVFIASEKLKKGNLNDEVRENLLQAKNLDPLNIDAYLLLGIYYGEKHSLNLALKEFNAAINLDPLNKQAKELRKYYLKIYQEGE